MNFRLNRTLAAVAFCLLLANRGFAQGDAPHSLWDVYAQFLVKAKYVDMTHTITPSIPVWSGFGPAKFFRTIDPKTGKPYAYKTDNFEASGYNLATDQLGTQLDPPAHWNPDYPAIDELPPTFAVRPLVIISIADKVAKDPGYALHVDDIKAWEAAHGTIPPGSVVFVRSDWSKAWPDPALATKTVFPGVGPGCVEVFAPGAAHPLSRPRAAGHGRDARSGRRGVAAAKRLHAGGRRRNLDQVPEVGALVEIGYPKFGGGTGGYARFIAICPPEWKHGVAIDPAKESPLPKMPTPLHWDEKAGMRVR